MAAFFMSIPFDEYDEVISLTSFKPLIGMPA